MSLHEKKCIPCEKGASPLQGEALKSLYSHISPEWELVNEHHLYRSYKFKNFSEALSFTNKIGELAEAEGHHPDIELSWGKVILKLFTHKIDGLTDADFIFAAKCDQIS